jgi:hypothetical protein
MSPLAFIAAVAWPVAIVLIGVLYRGPLAKLVTGQRTTLKAGSFEFAWENARPTLPRPTPMPVDKGSVTAPRAGRLASLLVDLARQSPAQAVIAAYTQLGDAFGRGLKEIGAELEVEHRDAMALARASEAAEITGPEITDAVHGLEVLRNLAQHGPEQSVSEGRAYEYLAMADAVLYAIASSLARDSRSEAGSAPVRAR